MSFDVMFNFIKGVLNNSYTTLMYVYWLLWHCDSLLFNNETQRIKNHKQT